MSIEDMFPHYEPDADGYYIHKGCGAPIVSSLYKMGCAKCSPDVLNIDRRILAWIQVEERERVAALLVEKLLDIERDSSEGTMIDPDRVEHMVREACEYWEGSE